MIPIRRCLHLTVALLASILVACGGDDDSPSDAPATTPAATEDPYAAAAEYVYGADWEKWYGKKADPDKAPVTLGWVNSEGGLLNFPFWTRTVDATVDLVNEQLGGIAGHPLRVEKCITNGTDESQGQQCAQQFLNHGDIAAIASGALQVGGGAFVETLDGRIPFSGVVPTGALAATENSFQLGPGSLNFGTVANYLSTVKNAKTASLIVPDDPTLRTVAEGVVDLMDQAGVATTGVYFSPTGSDVLAPLAAGDADSRDAIFVLIQNDAQCLAVARALDQLAVTKPVVSTPTCVSPEVKADYGDYPAWTYYTTYVNPLAPPAGNDEITAFVEMMREYNPQGEEDITRRYTPLVAAQVLTAAQWLNEAGPDSPTPEAVAKVAERFTGPIFAGPEVAKFGIDPFPGVATLAAQFYVYEGEDEWQVDADGQWLCPEPKPENC